MEYILSLSPFIIVLIVATFNWLMTFLGASLVLFVKSASKKLVCIALGSSAGIMIAASFFSLILPAKEQLESTGKLNLLIIPVGFICGVSLLMLIDKLLPHEHMMSHVQEGINPDHYSKNKLLMLAMTLHNIPEGLAVGVAFAGCQNENYLAALILAIGIGIQNFPEGTAISLPMHQCGKSRFKAMMYGQFSALVEVPAALLGYAFATLINGILPFALCFTAGAMMFVCIEELIPEANATEGIDLGTISFMVGFVIMMSLDILLS
ncbi:ZIP family metal transporter [[Clostridium] saccharogumia]|uniref:ZIP family metal transporter n=1 Tax=Thomasclavelia saccharogumia TaxID=341225 RepID=UPI001D08F47E|nr:ZIP family metal transporter [Thomasclavelia saccharogumia]MCB6706903.1 ZIP family metal transporter [Thomasclavelia saccharogumia]